MCNAARHWYVCCVLNCFWYGISRQTSRETSWCTSKGSARGHFKVQFKGLFKVDFNGEYILNTPLNYSNKFCSWCSTITMIQGRKFWFGLNRAPGSVDQCWGCTGTVVVVQTGTLRMHQWQPQQIGRMSHILCSKFYDWLIKCSMVCEAVIMTLMS